MIMIIIINKRQVKIKWQNFSFQFFSSVLGNWIGQIGLNWFVLTTYHNAVYLGLVNFADSYNFIAKCGQAQLLINMIKEIYLE